MGINYGFPKGDDKARMEALAQEIQRDGLKEPLAVKQRKDSQWYELLDGQYRFGAPVDVPHRRTIPVRIVGPVDETEVATIAPLAGTFDGE